MPNFFFQLNSSPILMWIVGNVVTLVGYLANCLCAGHKEMEDSALTSRSSRSRDRGTVSFGRLNATAVENPVTSRMGTEESLLDGRSRGLDLKESCTAPLCSVLVELPRVFCSH